MFTATHFPWTIWIYTTYIKLVRRLDADQVLHEGHELISCGQWSCIHVAWTRLQRFPWAWLHCCMQGKLSSPCQPKSKMRTTATVLLLGQSCLQSLCMLKPLTHHNRGALNQRSLPLWPPPAWQGLIMLPCMHGKNLALARPSKSHNVPCSLTCQVSPQHLLGSHSFHLVGFLPSI